MTEMASSCSDVPLSSVIPVTEKSSLDLSLFASQFDQKNAFLFLVSLFAILSFLSLYRLCERRKGHRNGGYAPIVNQVNAPNIELVRLALEIKA